MIKLNKIKQLLGFALLGASVSLAALIGVRLYLGNVPEQKLPALPKNIELSLQKIHYTETRDGVKKWDLFAEKGELDRSRDVTILSNVRFVLVGEGKSGDISIVANNAEYNNSSKDVMLTGNVVAKSASGSEFSTDSARYIASRSLVVSKDRVHYDDGKLMLDGVGLEFMVKTRDLRVLNQVVATIRPGSRN